MGISQRATMSIWSARLCLCVVALLCLTITPVDADLPVHCTHAEVQGEWVFHRGQGGLEKAGAKCSKGAKRFDDRTDAYGLGEPNYKVVDQMKVKLLEPNVAVHTNAQGKQVKGTWTMIYDEGFEVVLAGHKYFAFSKFKKGGHCEDSTQCDVQRSSCHKTFPGWYHNEQNPDKASWGCYHAHKTGTGHKDKEYRIMDTTEFLQKSHRLWIHRWLLWILQPQENDARTAQQWTHCCRFQYRGWSVALRIWALRICRVIGGNCRVRPSCLHLGCL